MPATVLVFNPGLQDGVENPGTTHSVFPHSAPLFVILPPFPSPLPINPVKEFGNTLARA